MAHVVQIVEISFVLPSGNYELIQHSYSNLNYEMFHVKLLTLTYYIDSFHYFDFLVTSQVPCVMESLDVDILILNLNNKYYPSSISHMVQVIALLLHQLLNLR